MNMLNRRRDLRYPVRDITIADVGTVTDISRGGARIRKNSAEELSVEEMVVPLTDEGVRAAIVWQTDTYLGLKLIDQLKDLNSSARDLRFLQEASVKPYLGMKDEGPSGYQDDSLLHSLMDLLVELDMPIIDINKLKSIIHQESGLEKTETGDEGPDQENKDVNENDQGAVNQDGLSMEDEILRKAAGADPDPHATSIDLDYAIALIGIDAVKDVVKKYLKKQLARAQSSIQNHNVFNILKAVVMHSISSYFGYSDKDGKAKAMLSYETVALERLLKNSTGLLHNYYSGPGPLYSEISRAYERLLFGTDMIAENYKFFHHTKKNFNELFYGYIIAYQTLNLSYTLPDSVRLSLTSKNLRFSSIAILLILVLNVIVEKDRKCGSALVKKLEGKGMKDRRVAGIIDEIITETNHLLTEYEVPGKLGRASLPSSCEEVEKSFPKEVHFSYLFDALRKMDTKTTRRLAIRYDDTTFAHYVLHKILNGSDFTLSSRNLCVIPCNNLLGDSVYYEDFTDFDLLVLKDVDRLQRAHFSIFSKLWSIFEGDIIVTFNSYHFIDFTHDRLYQIIKECIIDFPSYYAGDTIYKAMLNETVKYMQTASEQKIDTAKYLDDIYTMNEVKADILQKRLLSKKAGAHPG